jgi:hypothetical protein
MAFAGSTLDAYPLMIQFRNWLEVHPLARRGRAHRCAAANRSQDIVDLKSEMRTVFNDMRLELANTRIAESFSPC